MVQQKNLAFKWISGLRTLTVLKDAVKYQRRRALTQILTDIDFNDKEVLDFITGNRSISAESAGMQNL